jgi:hypothetical protein
VITRASGGAPARRTCQRDVSFGAWGAAARGRTVNVRILRRSLDGPLPPAKPDEVTDLCVGDPDRDARGQTGFGRFESAYVHPPPSPGLDPRIHLLRIDFAKMMDAGGKPRMTTERVNHPGTPLVVLFRITSSAASLISLPGGKSPSISFRSSSAALLPISRLACRTVVIGGL